MRILILGNDYSAKCFYDLFASSKENLIFSTSENYSDVDFSCMDDVADFIDANDINFVLVTDEKYINSNILELLNSKNVVIFAPSEEAASISISKAFAKRFMYKNQIPTPKFQIFEKPQLALDYVKNMQNALAIKPDNHSIRECTQFCETTNQAEQIIKNLFSTGNEKIVIEDYVEGKNIEIFILSDGFKFQILGISAKYQNNIAYFEPEFINDEIIQNIIENAISPTIEALVAQGDEYIGILGFDIIIKNDNSFSLVGYNNFFDDIDIDFYTKGFNVDWIDVFKRTVIGDVFSKYEIVPKNDYMLTLRQDGKIHFINAKTKNNLEIYLNELYDNKEYYEAQKIWKY